jgi:hypothetical protein
VLFGVQRTPSSTHIVEHREARSAEGALVRRIPMTLHKGTGGLIDPGAFLCAKKQEVCDHRAVESLHRLIEGSTRKKKGKHHV